MIVTDIIQRFIQADGREVCETVVKLCNGRRYFHWDTDGRWCNAAGKLLSAGYGRRIRAAWRRFEEDETPRDCGGVEGGCDVCLALYGASEED